MMQTIRDRAQGIVIWIIVGLIIITFATFGLESYLSGTGKVNVASVNGTDISESDFLHAYQQEQSRMQAMLGKNYRPDLINPAALKRQVLEQMIQRTLLLQMVKDAGMRVAPQVVGEQIRAISAFQEKGQFSKPRYEQVLRAQGLNEQGFEHDMARDIMIQQLVNGVSQSAFATQPELATYERLLRQQRDVGVLNIPDQGFLASARISDAEIKAYYDKHAKEFMTPEQVSVRYIKLSQAQIAKGIAVSDAELEQYYKDHSQQFIKHPEERRVRHILIRVDKQTDDANALQEIEKLRKEIEAGASFAAVAEKSSQDTFSAKKGGDLGYVTPGMMDGALDKVIFSLKPGELSKPVRSRFGYHLIEVEAIKPAEVESFAAAKDKIRHDVQMQKASLQFYEEADQLTNLSYEHPDSLDFVAKQLGLKVEQTPLFSRQGTKDGIAANPKVVTAAFSDEVLNQGLNSDPVEVGPSEYVVVRLANHKAAEEKPLAEVQAEIEKLLRQQWAAKAAREAADKALAALDKGAKPEQVAADYQGASWSRIGFIGRNPALGDKTAKPVDDTLRAAAFRLPKPSSAERPSRKMIGLPGGGAAVLVVYGVKEGPAGDAAQTRQLQAALGEAFGKTEFDALLQDARARAKVTINEKVLNSAEQ